MFISFRRLRKNGSAFALFFEAIGRSSCICLAILILSGAISQAAVQKDEASKQDLQQEVDTARILTGKLILPEGIETSVEGAEIEIGSIDGKNFMILEKLVTVDGTFQAKITASAVGIFAYTKDAKAARVALVDNPDEPIELNLLPTQDYHGQLIDKDDKPVAGQIVRATALISKVPNPHGRADHFEARKAITALTDSEGNYTLKGIPTNVEMRLLTNSKYDSGYNAGLGHIYLTPSDGRPRSVRRLVKGRVAKPKETLEQRFNRIQRDCSLSGYRLMVVVTRLPKNPNKSNKDRIIYFANNDLIHYYMQLMISLDSKEMSVADLEFMKSKNWPSPTKNKVFACVYDKGAKELGRINISLDEDDYHKRADSFVSDYAVKRPDAKQKWDKIFTEAKSSGRNVWVRRSGRYCGCCFVLTRWLDDNRELLSKDYLMLKIDRDRDLNGGELTGHLPNSRVSGIPFHGIFDQDEKLLIDSLSPTGNIGEIEGYEGKKYLRKMLNETRNRLTDAEINTIVESVADDGPAIDRSREHALRNEAFSGKTSKPFTIFGFKFSMANDILPFMIYFYLTILIFILPIGWLMTLLGFPGNWVMFGSAAAYAYLTRDASSLNLGWPTVAVVGGLAVLGELLELGASAMGVARVGGSRRGALLALIGSMVGAIVGLFVGLPIPIVGSLIAVVFFSALGALAGAMLGEQWKGRESHERWEVGKAAFWGRLLGTVAKIMIASIIAVTILAGLFW
jgi:uncharacterized protein YqgC (DUF456 family)